MHASRRGATSARHRQAAIARPTVGRTDQTSAQRAMAAAPLRFAPSGDDAGPMRLLHPRALPTKPSEARRFRRQSSWKPNRLSRAEPSRLASHRAAPTDFLLSLLWRATREARLALTASTAQATPRFKMRACRSAARAREAPARRPRQIFPKFFLAGSGG